MKSNERIKRYLESYDTWDKALLNIVKIEERIISIWGKSLVGKPQFTTLISPPPSLLAKLI